MKNVGLCLCGSGENYTACCGKYIKGAIPAPTAEALMRSRYTAYALKKVDYLLETTHPDFRTEELAEAIASWARKTDWIKLHIIATDAGQENDTEGRVEFVAEYMTDSTIGRHHECSLFQKKNGIWLYVDEETTTD